MVRVSDDRLSDLEEVWLCGSGVAVWKWGMNRYINREADIARGVALWGEGWTNVRE